MLAYATHDGKISLSEEVTFKADIFRVPKRFQQAHLHESDESWMAQVCRKYVMEFPVNPYGIIFAGDTGLGKTHYACAVLNELLRIYSQTWALTAFYFNLSQDLPALLDRKAARDYDSYQHVIYALENVDVLIVDDLLHISSQEWVKEVLYRIYEARYANAFRTITTLNAKIESGDAGLDWSPISETYNDAFMRRVVDSAGPNLILL